MSTALLIAIIAVCVFTALCVVRFLEVLRVADEERKATDAWWASRQQYQPRDPSSLSDDSPEPK